jgi:tape measure domain-containing protein
MSSIDERVVNMQFNNAQFEAGIKQTLASLEALSKSLKLEGAHKGLSDISAAAQHVQLGHIATAVDDIAGRFKAMSVVAVTALATIAHSAITAGTSLIKSLTIDPVKAGLQEYQTNINSIQTILSNTRWQHTGLEDVNKALDTLNRYSDQTIYNFSQMARNIGTFTAAGVKLDVATNAIKGIANLAAVSGSNAEQASMAMYQLSQALATGTVKLIDWNSVVNAGMGGKVFQDALMQTARVHGVAIDKMLKDAGSFRATLEKGWLSASILTETLQHFTGDLTEQQIISQGYTQQQAAEIIAMGKDAQDAATKVKTITQLLSTLREAAGSGWAKTWQMIFGDFEEARTFFTDANNVLGAFIMNSADARNKVLADWKALGGRTVLIEAISNAFHALLAILKPIRDAFREIFPKKTGQDLYNLTVILRDFTEFIQISAETADKLRRTFAGVFAVFGIGYDIIKQVARVLFELFTAAGEGGTGILDVTANIGDFLVALRKAINEGEGLVKFFNGVRDVLQVIINIIKQVIHFFAQLTDGLGANGAADAAGEFVARFEPFGALANIIATTWSNVVRIFDNLFHTLSPLASKMIEWFHGLSDAVGGINFDTILHAINTGVLVSFAIMIKRAIGRGGISGAISQLTGTLSTMQNTLRATTLLEIALAIGILAASISVLSKIDAAGLTRSVTAIGAMLTELMAALFVLQVMPGNNVIRVYAMAGSLILLATAIDVLAVAVKKLSDIDAKELHRGLIATMLLIGSIVAAARFLPPQASLISTGLGLLILAAAVRVLASSVRDMSGLNWQELAKGLSAVGVILAELTLFSRFAGANATGILAGAGLVLLAAAIKILASAVLDISGISWENIGKGMAVLATSLGLMSAALLLIPPTAPLSAAGVAIVAASMLILADAMKSMSGISWENVGKGMAVLAVSLTLITAALVVLSDAAPTALLSAGAIYIVAAAINILSDALQVMGGMSWTELAKGLIVLAGALTIIVVALNLMQTGVAGALALLIVAGALTVLAGVLKILGSMSWGEIIKGLVSLAGAFVVLGLAGLVLSPIIPALLGLGAALFLIGAGLALVGAGVFLFATGLTALSVAGAAGAAAITAILSAVISLIPVLAQQVGVALLILIDVLIEAVPKIVDLIVKLLSQLFDRLDEILPKLEKVIIKLVTLILNVLTQAIPKMITAGLKILTAVLEGIRDNIYKLAIVAGDAIVQFLKGVSANLPKMIQAGVDLIVAFVKGLALAIDNNSERMGAAGADLGIAIIKGMIKGLRGGLGRVADAARDVAKSALNAALDFLGISSPSKAFVEVGQESDEGFALGIDKYAHVVAASAKDVGDTAVESMRKSVSRLAGIVYGNMELSPVITPVVDLTDVEREVGKINDIFLSPTRRVNVGLSYSSAAQAGDQIDENKTILERSRDVETGDTFIYTQNNTSPKALSTADIYRQTRNQIATVKGGLPK